jgi:hypothetical protein
MFNINHFLCFLFTKYTLYIFPILQFFFYDRSIIMTQLRTLVFTGGGFHAFWYNLGVSSLLDKNNMPLLEGWSSGAIACVVGFFLSEIGQTKVLQVALETKDEIKIKLFGTLRTVTYNFLNKLLPDDAHIRLSGKIGIYLTNNTLQGFIVSHWNSRSELISCVIASSFVPGITDFAFHDNQYNCIDGGFARNLNSLYTDKFVVQYTDDKLDVIQQFIPISPIKAMQLFMLGRTILFNSVSHNSFP